MDFVERLRAVLRQTYHLRLANMKSLGFEVSDDLPGMACCDGVGFDDS